jgi:hypothetical protein
MAVVCGVELPAKLGIVLSASATFEVALPWSVTALTTETGVGELYPSRWMREPETTTSCRDGDAGCAS